MFVALVSSWPTTLLLDNNNAITVESAVFAWLLEKEAKLK
jgi:hypothetical protein